MEAAQKTGLGTCCLTCFLSILKIQCFTQEQTHSISRELVCSTCFQLDPKHYFKIMSFLPIPVRAGDDTTAMALLRRLLAAIPPPLPFLVDDFLRQRFHAHTGMIPALSTLLISNLYLLSIDIDQLLQQNI